MLRCTARLRKFLADFTLTVEDPSESDWYANLLWIQGRKCLLVTHAGTLFSVFVPDVRAADLRRTVGFVAPRIAAQLAAEGFPENSLGELDVNGSRIAKTADRSIVGGMNDQAALCQHIVADSGGLQHLDLAALHHHLQRNILSARGYVPPIDLVSAWTPPRP